MRLVSSQRILWTLLAVYWIFLTGLLLTPQPWQYLFNIGSPVPQIVQQSLSDSIQHLIAFALLGALARAASTSNGGSPGPLLLMSLCCYIIITELLQLIIPERFFQWLDLLFNTAGLAIGWAFPALLARRRNC